MIARYTTGAIIPFIVLVVCTIITYLILVKSKTKFYKSGNSRNKELDLLKTLIGMDCFFFMCYSPVCILLITIHLMPLTVFLIALNLSSFILDCHATLSIFMHLISNKIFRKRFFYAISTKKYSESRGMSTSTFRLKTKSQSNKRANT